MKTFSSNSLRGFGGSDGLGKREQTFIAVIFILVAYILYLLVGHNKPVSIVDTHLEHYQSQ